MQRDFDVVWSRMAPDQRKQFKIEGERTYLAEPDLGPLARLNLFVGPNNCGKSRLLRHLFASGPESSGIFVHSGIERAFSELAKDPDLFQDLLALDSPIRQIAKAENPLLKRDIPALQSITQGAEDARRFFSDGLGSRLKSTLEDIIKVLSEKRVPAEAPRRQMQELVERLREIHGRVAKALPATPPPTFKRVYIPTLRAMRSFNDSNPPNDDMGKDVVSRYFPELKEPSGPETGLKAPRYVISGQGLFSHVRASLLGSYEQRESMAAFQAFVGDHFLEGKRFTVIPKERDTGEKMNTVLHVKIGDELERPIHMVGDGLAQLIILTVPLFLFPTERLLLFIEEPENFLHPGFQRMIAEAFTNPPPGASPGVQVFCTTHSNHLLDLTLDSDDVSVFRFRKEFPDDQSRQRVPVVVITPRSNASLPLLRELGVQASSVMLANCTIWVEGITDRLYLRRYLSLYQDELSSKMPGLKRFAEDLHYAFVEYGGSNVTHWSFLDDEGIRVDRLCGELCLVADDDGVSTGQAEPAKRRRHERLRAVLNERFMPLPCREIENLLPPDVIAAVVRECESDPALDLKTVDAEAYRHEPIGRFIESNVLPGGYASKRTRGSAPYSEESGTVKDKMGFAEKALKHLNSWSEISPDAQQLAEALYRFVASRNSSMPIERNGVAPGGVK